MSVPAALLALPLLALLVAAGCPFARAAGPRRPLLPTLALAHLTAAAALAAGVTLGLAVTGRASLGWGVGGLAALALTGALWGRVAPAAEQERRAAEPSRLEGALARWRWALLALVAVGILTAIARVALLPLDWDGWAIWQLKAKALAAGDLRRLLTSPEYAYCHPDYPLLVPVHTWWLSAGGFDAKVGQAGGLLFLADLLLLFYEEARRRLSPVLALAGCAMILSWPGMQAHVSSGYADVPMAAYAFAAALFAARGSGAALALCLAGAALTKNEGLFTLAAVAVILVYRLVTCRTGRGAALRWLAPLLGAVAVLGLWSVTKGRWHLYADLLDPAHWSPDLAAELPGRIAVIAAGFLRSAVSVGPWYPGWGFLWLVAPVAAALAPPERRRESLPCWILVAAHFAGAAAAYAVTPANIHSHITTSLDRLWLHVAPAALLTVLLCLVPCEEAPRPTGPVPSAGDAP